MWEDAEDALTFSSGMSAIATLLLTFVQPGDVIVHSGPLYAATETLIAKILGRFGVHYLDFPAGATREEIDAVIASAKAKGRVSLIYPRKPGQPDQCPGRCRSGRRRARRRIRCRRQAADRDRQYIPGATVGQAAGAGRRPQRLQPHQICRRAQRPGRRRDRRQQGADQPDPDDAQHDRRRSATPTPRGCCCAASKRSNCGWTAPARMPRRSANSCATIPRSRRSAISASSSRDRARPTSTIAIAPAPGSTFSLYLKGGEREAFAFLDALQIAHLAVSLGGTETLASAPAAMTHLSVPDERKAALGITDNLVRISIGVENADDLIADFTNALNAI